MKTYEMEEEIKIYNTILYIVMMTTSAENKQVIWETFTNSLI